MPGKRKTRRQWRRVQTGSNVLEKVVQADSDFTRWARRETFREAVLL